MQEEELAKKQGEELQYLNQRINEISEKEAKVLAKEARMIAEFVESKMKMLKTCYGKSDATVKESINRLIRSSQLQCFMAEAETEETKLDKMMYSERRIKDHINDGLLDEPRIREFYSFYFGRYRLFFRCFERDFLEQENIDESFLDDVFSPKEGDYYVSEEKLEIAGATIIDKAFINEVRRENFSMVEFYTAIQSENSLCQWYGVANDWDIERKDYGKLKKAVSDSLNQKREYKVCGIVHGTGGSGKSTVLRRLCVNFQDIENCMVIWVNEVMQFCQNGISVIKQDIEANSNKKYLIVIEDWYRMLDKQPDTASELLEQIHKYNNIRIVIGDRTIDGKPYENYGSDYNLLLSSNENKEIIEQIIKKYPDWQEASERLFESLKSDEPTLFLLLFILARIIQDKLDANSMNLADPAIVFRNIVKSDLKFIEDKYAGLAKALYYWGCIYAKHKITISYDTFLAIADNYNGNNKVSKHFSCWDIKDTILDRLKIYINHNYSIVNFHIATSSKQLNDIITNGHFHEHSSSLYFGFPSTDKEFIQFNHDILVDEGFNKIDLGFSDTVMIDLLEIITEFGDEISASLFLETMIKYEKQIFKSRKKKLLLIDKLIEKGNTHPSYVSALVRLELSYDEIMNYMSRLAEIKNFSILTELVQMGVTGKNFREIFK